MGYVEHLLRGHLVTYQNELSRYKYLGQDEGVQSCLAVISELEYVLELLIDNDTYQNY